MGDLDRSVVQDIDWVSGSCMMINRQAFDAVGGFDAGYFMASDVASAIAGNLQSTGSLSRFSRDSAVLTALPDW
jgi:hypothetical protein